jgi:hypothetical protein
MKKIITLILLFVCLLTTPTANGQTYRTKVFADRIKTLLVHNSHSWNQAPVMTLDSGETITISFDLLSPLREYYTYKVIHCDADWKISQLSDFEYVTGLQYNHMSDYANSFNANPDYVNYQLVFPNSSNELLVSGNYVIEVYDENGDAVLHACFSAVEPLASVQASVSAVTDKGANTKYQAVKVEVAYGKEVRTPAQDLKVYVMQNNRYDNQAALVKPLSLQSGKAVYDHNPALIFNAGNEYRTFEMITTQYNGLGIETIEYHSPYHHVFLKPGTNRSNRAYSFDNDLNGRVYIRSLAYEDAELQSDYHIVHFYLPCDKPFADDVYIMSDAFNNIFDYRSRMDYIAEEGGYVKSVLLKEGYYNYLFVTRKDSQSPALTSTIEGDHYQTENEYRVMVYFRPFGQRYDRLIGVGNAQFN